MKDSGVKVNFTLGFSARENVLVTRVSRPDYVNVFLGRIGAYMINNKLGDGSGAGEKAVISSQNWVTGLTADNPWQTKQIAASLRNYNQLELLAGVDVFTMPPKVAAAGHKELKGKFTSRTHENYEVNMNDTAKDAHIEKFWEVDDKILKLSERLAGKLTFNRAGTDSHSSRRRLRRYVPFPFKGREKLYSILMGKSRYIQDGRIKSKKERLLPIPY